jgi:hypothetical protein
MSSRGIKHVKKYMHSVRSVIASTFSVCECQLSVLSYKVGADERKGTKKDGPSLLKGLMTQRNIFSLFSVTCTK